MTASEFIRWLRRPAEPEAETVHRQDGGHSIMSAGGTQDVTTGGYYARVNEGGEPVEIHAIGGGGGGGSTSASGGADGSGPMTSHGWSTSGSVSYDHAFNTRPGLHVHWRNIPEGDLYAMGKAPEREVPMVTTGIRGIRIRDEE